jgi:hypothetical protein
MPLATVADNYVLDQLGANRLLYASLHSAYSATGANELTGGSPAYARQALAWSAASGAGKNLSASPTFNVPGGSTVAWVGFWDAATAGNFQGMCPAGSGQPEAFTAAITGNLFTAPGTAYSAGQAVVLLPAPGSSLPGGFSIGTIYYVVSPSGSTFELAAASGGAAITVTSAGAGLVQAITPEVFAGQGNYTPSNPTSGSLLFMV